MSDAAVTIETEDGQFGIVDGQGRLVIPTKDGGTIYRLNWRSKASKTSSHGENIALGMDSSALYGLADDIVREVQADEISRREYIESLAKAIEMLGIKLEDPRAADNDSSAPLEGMSSFRHPLLLQSAIRFQADFVSELLPTDGPVKIRDDSPEPPTGAMDNTSAEPGVTSNDLADALEKDLNHYLTQTASEYYPDTTRMAFWVGLMGGGFKKVYHCPIRKRPVIESIDINDLIVDHAATDLRNAARVTHRIKMRHNQVRRMISLKVYRDVPLGQPMHKQDAVEMAADRATGMSSISLLPSDHLHTIYETATERDIEGEDWLPYKITVDVDSKEVLSIYRNWDEDDERKLARQEIVKYAYIDALGFYPLGLVHILGNTVRALTAAFREFLDAGMFGNFPGFLFSSDAGKQQTNQFRVAPGSGVPIQTGGKPIGEVVGNLPYKSPDAAFMQFIQHVEESGKALGGEASVPLSEGTANMPVGTMLAQIEQTLKPIKGVFKGLHRSQAEEFQLLKRRFQEDPEALWRFNKKPAHQWEEVEFLEALENAELVPMADPNTASQVQRIAIAWAMLELAKTAPYLFHERDTALRFMRMIGIPDPEGILASAQEIQQAKAAMAPQPPASKQSNPALDAANAQKAQAQAALAQAQTQKTNTETQQSGQEFSAGLADKQAERQFKGAELLTESKERDADRKSHLEIAQINQESAKLKTGADLAKAGTEHAADAMESEQQRHHETGMAAADANHEATLAAQSQTAQGEQADADRDHKVQIAGMQPIKEKK